MKTIILLAIVPLLAISAQERKIPSNMLKGIEVVTDEFTGIQTYKSKSNLLRIERKGDETRLILNLSCGAYDTPVDLAKVYVLTDGKTTIFDDNQAFNRKKVAQRYMSKNATGKFGTSSYKGAEFETRTFIIESLEVDAVPILEMVRSMADNRGKIKYEGNNASIVYEISKKDAESMTKILTIYDYLTNE
jgi:hypothetical protein